MNWYNYILLAILAFLAISFVLIPKLREDVIADKGEVNFKGVSIKGGVYLVLIISSVGLLVFFNLPTDTPLPPPKDFYAIKPSGQLTNPEFKFNNHIDELGIEIQSVGSNLLFPSASFEITKKEDGNFWIINGDKNWGNLGTNIPRFSISEVFENHKKMTRQKAERSWKKEVKLFSSFRIKMSGTRKDPEYKIFDQLVNVYSTTKGNDEFDKNKTLWVPKGGYEKDGFIFFFKVLEADVFGRINPKNGEEKDDFSYDGWCRFIGIKLRLEPE